MAWTFCEKYSSGAFLVSEHDPDLRDDEHADVEAGGGEAEPIWGRTLLLFSVPGENVL